MVRFYRLLIPATFSYGVKFERAEIERLFIYGHENGVEM